MGNGCSLTRESVLFKERSSFIFPTSCHCFLVPMNLQLSWLTTIPHPLPCSMVPPVYCYLLHTPRPLQRLLSYHSGTYHHKHPTFPSIRFLFNHRIFCHILQICSFIHHHLHHQIVSLVSPLWIAGEMKRGTHQQARTLHFILHSSTNSPPTPKEGEENIAIQ